VALSLRGRGIKRVRPLLGGLDGWVRLSYPLEQIAVAAIHVTASANPSTAGL